MEYDFFEEKERENDTEEINVESVPAPIELKEDPTMGAGNKKGKQDKKPRWTRIVGAILLAVITFCGGMLTQWAILDPEMRTLIKVKERIEKDYYKEVTDEEFYAAVFGGINEQLLDRYSEYMTSEQFAEATRDLEGNRSGVGLFFTTGDGKELDIARVCGNSPAEEAGLKAGDEIVACGKTETGMNAVTTFDEFSAFLDECATEEEFYMTVQTKGVARTVKLSKKEYVENYVFYRTNEKAYAFTGANATTLTEKGEPMSALNDDTAYVRLVQFTGNAAEEFRLIMEQFKKDGKKNLVLDLRENGGGYLDTMQSIASYFCKSATSSKPVVAVADYGEKKTSYSAYENYYKEYFSEDSRICVLADEGSASASECLIGCMLDYGAVTYADICLVARDGTAKTFGKGIMQETYIVNLLKQDALKLTTAEIRWPLSMTSIHGRGVLAEDGTKTVENGADFETETKNAIEALFLAAQDHVESGF